MTKLIAQMVVRNEADRYLEKVLQDLLQFVDEIVVTDDCSDDDTLKVVGDYTDLFYQTSEQLFTTDEGKLRQEAWQNLSYTAKEGDWIIAVDADEIIWSTQKSIHHILMTARHDVIGLDFTNMWNDTQYRVDKFWAPMTCSKLFRFREGGSIKDRKLACGSEPTYVAEEIQKGRWHSGVGLKIQHWGYARDEDKLAKYNRYMEIDGGRYHSGSHLASIMDKEVQLVDWDFERII